MFNRSRNAGAQTKTIMEKNVNEILPRLCKENEVLTNTYTTGCSGRREPGRQFPPFSFTAP